MQSVDNSVMLALIVSCFIENISNDDGGFSNRGKRRSKIQFLVVLSY